MKAVQSELEIKSEPQETPKLSDLWTSTSRKIEPTEDDSRNQNPSEFVTGRSTGMKMVPSDEMSNWRSPK